MQTSMKNSSNPVFNLDQFTPYRLSVLTNTISQGISQTYLQPFGISVTEWRIVAVIGAQPKLTASEIVSRTAMDKVTISRAVKSLIEKGLLERTTDPEDRRCRRHCLSAAGLNVFREITPRAQQYESELLRVLSPDQLGFLQTLLDLLQDQAVRLKQKHKPE
jgi:DNA-binding MarR family transcriptional regulator